MYNTLDPEEGIVKKLEAKGFEEAEKLEVKRGLHMYSGYPKPAKFFRLDFEAEHHNVEEIYFWIVGHARDDFGYPIMQKITDTHAASAASSIFGDMQGRLGAQQSNVSNYMGMMGKLLKDLFALVRELRQLEERLGYYTQSYDTKLDFKARRGAETTLKDVWITLIEGGTQNPASVYGMSQKVNFTVLPDLFFAAPPMEDENEVGKYVDSLDFNTSVKNAVERKLFQYLIWKKKTLNELTNKRRFQIRYLRQHYETIRMYMQWIKPYLKNIKRLSQNQNMMDDPMMIHSFQTNMTEIEVLLTKPGTKVGPKGSEKEFHPVVLLSFVFRSKPSMDFHAKDAYHQKGPIHVGKTEVTMRAYGWTREEIDNYMKYRQEEDFDILMNFDQSVSDSMEFLGEDLERYLREAHADLPDDAFARLHSLKKKKDEPDKNQSREPENIMTLITAPIKGIGDLFSPLLPKVQIERSILNIFTGSRSTVAKELKAQEKDARKDVGRKAAGVIWQCFKNYKKAHKIVAW